jgi:hypothetical protein
MGGLRRGLVLVGVVMAVLVQAAGAQVATTTVRDTVYRADGTAAGGMVLVSWSGFTTAAGSAVPAGTTSVTIGAGGLLTVALAPNAGGTPMGSYYTAVFHLDDGSTSREYWVVPVTGAGGGPVTLSAVINSVLPVSVAMQTVSKNYVDTAIAAAVAGGGNAGAITSGTISVARLPLFGASGATHSAGIVPDAGATAGTTRFLREDGTFAVPPGTSSGGSAVGAYLELAPAFSISVAASTTVWIGASNATTTSANSALYYGTVQHNATITGVEYIVDTNGGGGFGSGQTGTFTLFDITTGSTIAGSTATPGINLNTPMVGEATGLSATVAAGDKLQATFTTATGATTRTPMFRVIVYMQ